MQLINVGIHNDNNVSASDKVFVDPHFVGAEVRGQRHGEDYEKD